MDSWLYLPRTCLPQIDSAFRARHGNVSEACSTFWTVVRNSRGATSPCSLLREFRTLGCEVPFLAWVPSFSAEELQSLQMGQVHFPVLPHAIRLWWIPKGSGWSWNESPPGSRRKTSQTDPCAERCDRSPCWTAWRVGRSSGAIGYWTWTINLILWLIVVSDSLYLFPFLSFLLRLEGGPQEEIFHSQHVGSNCRSKLPRSSKSSSF